VLTIESPSLCELINGPMDEYGIFKLKPQSDTKGEISSTSKTNFEHKIEENVIKHEQKIDTTTPVKEETEVSNNKNKLGKIEL